VPDHPLGKRVSGLFSAEPPGATGAVAGIGSALLIPELFTKPMRTGADTEIAALAALVARLDLRATERSAGPTRCRPRRGLRLRAADAGHLATAIAAGRAFHHQQHL